MGGEEPFFEAMKDTGSLPYAEGEMPVETEKQLQLAAQRDIGGPDFQQLLAGAGRFFGTKVDLINALNVFPVPDGDTGTNMWLTLKSAVESMDNSGEFGLGRAADMAAAGALMGARGNSGVILSQFLRGLARGLSGRERAGVPHLAKAFQYGVVMAYRAVSKPVEGTILTVAREMARGGKKASREDPTLGELLEIVVEAGYAALERTTDQLPVLKEAGVVDSGGCGLVVFMEGLLRAARGENMEPPIDTPYEAVEKSGVVGKPGHEVLPFNYCTEALVKGTGIRLHRLKEDLEPLGDSLLVVGDENIARVHVHTNHPGEVLELCLRRGSLHQVKIDNMLDQHREAFSRQDIHPGQSTPAGEKPAKGGVGLVAVCTGAGLEEIFRNLGCDRIISGGPTMNPKVQDFVDAIRGFRSDVVILPNDKNVRLAAEQAAQMVNMNVAVIPTNNIPQGIAAAMAFDPDSSLERNAEEMTERCRDIKTAEITFAVRASNIGGLSFEKGDIIGLTEGKVAAAAKSKSEVLLLVLEALSGEENEIISIVYGEDVSHEEAEALREEVGTRFPDKEIEFLSGGQPLYYFYVSVE